MKQEALKDCDQLITSYIFTDTEYETSNIRIRMNAVEAAPQQHLVRCNLLYGIKTLAIRQLAHEARYGAKFIESYHGQILYSGTLDEQNDESSSLEPFSNSSAESSETTTQKKQALSTQSLDVTNSTHTLLAITGSNDVRYKIDFYFAGRVIGKIAIFATVLETMMTLAERDSEDVIVDFSQARPSDLFWVFVKHDSDSIYPLQVYELIAILESLARYTVQKSRYQEMTFYFEINGDMVAWGCITRPMPSRAWCEGM